MSDIACAYETDLKETADAGAVTLWADEEARQRLTDLRDAVDAAGLRHGVASREQIIRELAPGKFGQYGCSVYAKVIRELVRAGLIDRATPTSIAPREPLRFVEPAQTALLG